jgi:hypothetical protein
MADEIVLLVSDEKDGKYGEITVLDSAHEMERLMETLLEEGCDRERMRVFSGAEAEFETTYRPVVSLTDDEAEAAAGQDQQDAPAKPQVVEVGGRAEPVPVQAGGDSGGSASPVRMSSMFRRVSDDASAVYVSACEAAG